MRLLFRLATPGLPEPVTPFHPFCIICDTDLDSQTGHANTKISTQTLESVKQTAIV